MEKTIQTIKQSFHLWSEYEMGQGCQDLNRTNPSSFLQVHPFFLRRGEWGTGVTVERHKQGREKFYRSKFGQELYNNDLKIERLLGYPSAGGPLTEKCTSEAIDVVVNSIKIKH